MKRDNMEQEERNTAKEKKKRNKGYPYKKKREDKQNG